MNRVLPVLAGLTLIAAAQLPVRAEEANENAVERAAEATGGAIKKGAEATGHAIKTGAEATGHAIKKGAEATGNALGITESDRERYAANERGEHRATGTVATIDHDSGLVSLASEKGTYQLHFPPDSLEGISTGDRLVVTTGFALPDRLEATGPGTRPERKVAADQSMRGEHWMTGTVTNVDASNGMVGVKTDEGLLKMQFSTDAARHLKAGEKIAVQLAFEASPPSTD